MPRPLLLPPSHIPGLHQVTELEITGGSKNQGQSPESFWDLCVVKQNWKYLPAAVNSGIQNLWSLWIVLASEEDADLLVHCPKVFGTLWTCIKNLNLFIWRPIFLMDTANQFIVTPCQPEILIKIILRDASLSALIVNVSIVPPCNLGEIKVYWWLFSYFSLCHVDIIFLMLRSRVEDIWFM